MQITETLAEGLKREYQIIITGADLDARVTEKLVEAQPEVAMKGFRKGKVPMALLRKQFGPRLLGEAMQEAVDGAMQDHLQGSGDRPAMQPDVKMVNENWKEGDDIVVAMSYEKLPEIPAVDFKAVKLEKLVAKPADADIDEALGNLAASAQNFETKKGKAADGDQIVIDFLGKLDGEPFDGGAAEDYPLVLGSGSFIPGFEEKLVGLKAGDEKSIDVTFPAEYGASHLAGKDVVFDITVKEVKKPVPAEVDDELAKKYGAESLDALKGQISERMAAEYTGAARQVLKRKLLDQLDTLVEFDLPSSLVEAEAGQIAHQLWHEENPEHQGHDHPEITPTDEHSKLAVRRVKLGLLLAELGQKNEVKVSDAEMTQAIMMQARQYPGQERAFFEFIQSNQAAQQQIRAPLFEDKVIDFIVELAEVTEKQITKDELKAAVDALEDE
ncbi:trigger factor [Roseicyclus mahoneyensis]|uniref:Trigger factor n=1 Tax=Roseicyclus mahoneyensis TaxID=164332 RepID=A0A316GMW0_9RHOB|nr:trigger factor [Roseicyclus mahoneyensis]PWK62139.1 trigger factor [Roseicyclus mahoneyensis]